MDERRHDDQDDRDEQPDERAGSDQGRDERDTEGLDPLEPIEELDLDAVASEGDVFAQMIAQLEADGEHGEQVVYDEQVGSPPRQTAVAMVVAMRHDDPDAFRALLDGMGGQAARTAAVALAMAEVSSELLSSSQRSDLPERMLRARAAALNHRSPIAAALAGGLVEYMTFSNTEVLGAGMLCELVNIWLSDDADLLLLDVYEFMFSLALVCHQTVLDYCEQRDLDPDKLLGDHALKIAGSA